MRAFRLSLGSRAPHLRPGPSRSLRAHQKGKGFGDVQKGQSTGQDDSGEGRRAKKGKPRASKGKSKRRMGPQSTPLQPQPEQTLARPDGIQEPTGSEPNMSACEEPDTNVLDEAAFQERLASLKSASTALAKEKELQETKKSILSGADTYDNPPSIMDSMRRDAADPDKVDPVSGSSNLVGAVGAFVIIAALLASVVGLDGDTPSGATSPELTKEQKAGLTKQLAAFDAALQANASDIDALEGAAVTAANLGDFKKAETLLARLTEEKRNDVDVWRLLAETRAALSQPGPAVAAYREAFSLARADLEVLKGFTSALMADSKQSEAVSVVKTAIIEAQSAAAVSEPSNERLQPIEVQLLLAKVYANWRGHTTEALATYDTVIKENPEDFRGFLAKGVLLRTEGRRGDADRAFLQARFLAPKELRGIVDRVSAPDQK